MPRSNNTIRRYMTPVPHSIGDEQTLARASRTMQELGIRHLPVLHGGRLVGILTERDVALVESFESVDPEIVRVAEAMSELPYAVAPDEPLANVARTMADERYGAAVVVERDKVVGIFTVVDACRALASVLGDGG